MESTGSISEPAYKDPNACLDSNDSVNLGCYYDQSQTDLPSNDLSGNVIQSATIAQALECRQASKEPAAKFRIYQNQGLRKVLGAF
jgi:hypothetical protein